MANRYWVGGNASWDATAGTKWSLTNGGPGGEAVPTAADDVFFSSGSGAVTCTISGSRVAKSIDCTGFTGTLAGASTPALTVSGSMTLVAGMTLTYAGTTTFNATGTLTSANKTLGPVVISGSGITVTLGDALTSSGTVTVTQGTFDTANFNITATALNSTNTNTRTITLGSSTVTLSATTAIDFTTNTNLTFNAGTSTISCSSTQVILIGGAASTSGVTFYNVSLTSTTATADSAIRGINTFNNLAVTGVSAAGFKAVLFDSSQTINGALSTTGTAGNRRVWFRGITYGIAQTLTINSAPSLTDADFRDIYVIGTAAPISGTRIGDLGGIRGITASTPKTVYWNLSGAQNWSANGWTDTSTGTPSTDFFPLAQDTATFTNAGSVTGTITMDSAIPYTGTVDMSGRTSAMTITNAGFAFTMYGNWINGSGVTIAGTGTITYSGRNTQTITSAGKTFTQPIAVDSYGGSVELADALNIGSNTLTVTNGTFDTKNFNVTAGSLSSNNSNVRTITLGSSTVTLSGTTPVTFTTSTNLTLSTGTSQVNLTATSACTFAGNGFTFYNVSFTGTTAVTHVVTGANTFNNLTFTAPASAGVMQCTFNLNQTINGTLTCAGATVIRRIYLRSNNTGATRTFTVNTLSATDCDFRDITIAGTAAGSSPTRAGDCGGNSGITFPSPKTVYWNLAGAQDWSATAWALGTGGSPDINNFPLAQDTVIFDEAAGSVTGTITINTAWNIGTFDASLRTSAMTLTTSTNAPLVHGDWKFGTGVTSSSTTGTITFAKRGTSTITSNGVTFGCNVTVDCVNGVVQLADALSLAGSRSLTHASGEFDAATYNVTAAGFAGESGNRTLRMGSGTWSMTTETAKAWVIGAPGTLSFYKGTANIVLTGNGSGSREFDGGALSYNKLTFGGTTGTPSYSMTNGDTFTELAATRTTAFTISISFTLTFGRWTITGSAGNVVTLTNAGSAALALTGACTSGIDYLAMGAIGLTSTSTAEFYAGANSTGTAAAPVYRTAKPADSTRYWVGGTGNWSDTNRWSTGSGGLGGASVPRSHDDVVFDTLSNSTAYTATVNAVTGGIRMKSLTIAGPLSGNLTLAGSVAMDGIHGNVTLPATGLTRTYTGSITLSSNSTGLTFTTNGVALASAITVNGIDCGWSLGSALDIGTSFLTITRGSFDLATYNLTAGSISSNSLNARTIDLGTGTITLSGSTPIDLGTTGTSRIPLTLTADTSQINCSTNTIQIQGNDKTFYNLSHTSTSAGTVTIGGVNSFNNLSFTGLTAAGMKQIALSANQTVTGTLTLSAGTDATMRHFIRSNAIGTTRTITAAAVSMTDVDFRDITIAGAAAPASGTRIGDCKGNSGITFTAATTRYWNLAGGGNWSGTGWAASSGASPAVNNFPLAQDTAVFEATGLNSGATVTVDQSYNIGTIDMSARTSNTMTLATGTSAPFIYGNWINGTGTTLTGTGEITFSGRAAQTFTSSGVTFTARLVVNSPNGSLTLQDAFTSNFNAVRTLEVNAGTFDASAYNVSLTAATTVVSLSNSTNVRTLAVGSGTWTIAGVATASVAWNAATATNLTVTGTGTISLTSASAKNFLGGGVAYTDITVNQGGAGALTITGNNTLKDITNTYKATGAANITLGNTIQRVSQFTAAGEAGRLLTIQGTSASSPCTLILTGATKPNVDYLAITGVRAYNLTDTWYAGTNSTNNGSLGWYFETAPITAGGGMFLMFL